MEFISISIDIANSTFLKRKINEVCENENLAEQKTKEVFNYLLDCEKDLYTGTFKNGLINDLFIVKSIGDELWYLINLDNLKDDIKKSTIQEIINILQNIARKFWHLNLYPQPIAKNNNKRFIVSKDIKYRDYVKNKITVDIIKNAYNFTSYRFGKLNEFYKSLISQSFDVEKNEQVKESYRSTIREIAYNLNMGDVQIEVKNDEVAYINNETRYDLIGTDVDHFFRVSKKAIPGLITVGDLIYKEYLFESISSTIDDKGTKIQFPIKFPSIEIDVSKDELKGFDEDYKMHYLPIKNESYINFPEVQRLLANYGFLDGHYSLSDRNWLSE
jgi:hypothetical protein